jgi:hypothetical protein
VFITTFHATYGGKGRFFLIDGKRRIIIVNLGKGGGKGDTIMPEKAATRKCDTIQKLQREVWQEAESRI